MGSRRSTAAAVIESAVVIPVRDLISGALVAPVGLAGTFAVIGVGSGLTALFGLVSVACRSAYLSDGDDQEQLKAPPTGTFLPPAEAHARMPI